MEKHTITLRELSAPPFVAALNQLAQLDLPASVSWWVGRVFETCQREHLRLALAQRKAVERHGGILRESGDIVWPDDKPDAPGAYAAENADLLAQEVELPIDRPITLPAGVTVKAAVLFPLSKIVNVATE